MDLQWMDIDVFLKQNKKTPQGYLSEQTWHLTYMSEKLKSPSSESKPGSRLLFGDLVVCCLLSKFNQRRPDNAAVSVSIFRIQFEKQIRAEKLSQSIT